MHVPLTRRIEVIASLTILAGVAAMSVAAEQANPLAQQPFSSIEDVVNKVRPRDIIQLGDGRLFMAFGPGAMGAYSTDGGKTWGDPFAMKDDKGNDVAPGLGTLIESKPGVLGFQHTHGYSYAFGWTRSTDAGRTWLSPVAINPLKGKPHNPHGHPRPFEDSVGQEAIVAGLDRGIALPDGRIVIPVAGALAGPVSPEPGHPVGVDGEETLFYSYVFYSDDDGQTWQRSRQMIFIVLEGRYGTNRKYYSYARGKGGFWEFEEPTVVGLTDGRLMMFGRSVLGRIFASYSKDKGVNWHAPVPKPLAAPNCNALLKRLGDGGILLIWNQCSPKENIDGYSRHRLSTAISTDEGETWKHFKNLESLDDVTYIEPPAVETLHGVYGPHYHQPKDRERYHRAPGSVRSCYPSARVLPDCVIVRYNYGCKTDETPDMNVTTKTRILPNAWFTSK